jgi:hypothetical protein
MRTQSLGIAVFFLAAALSGGCGDDSGGGKTTDNADPSNAKDSGAGAGDGDGDTTANPGDGDTTANPGDGDSKPDTDVGTETVPLNEGDPVTATDNTWTWVPVDGTFCHDGKSTGFGININPKSDKLIIHLDGGGACFSSGTCVSAIPSFDSSNFNGSGPQRPTMLRDAPNPFADYNMVYFPYCTGDVFTGTKMAGEGGGPQTGYTNVTRFLERIVPTFKSKVSTVILSGASAGAFGASWNWMRVQDAFGTIPVHVLDDSAPAMGPKYLSSCLQKHNAEVWGWADSIHPACKGCDVANGKVTQQLMEASIKRQKGKRFGLLSNDEDGTMKSFFAYGLNNCQNLDSFFPPAYPMGLYPEGLSDLRDRLKGYSNAAIFEITGGSHVLISGTGAWENTKIGDTSLVQWVTWFRDGDPKWVDLPAAP